MAAQALLRKQKAGMTSGNSNASGTGGVGSSTGVIKSMSVGANLTILIYFPFNVVPVSLK